MGQKFSPKEVNSLAPRLQLPVGEGRGMATSSSDHSKLGISDGFRRTWDTAEYEKQAKDRIKKEKEGDKKSGPSVPVHRELLKKRDYKVDLDSKLGKTLIITRDTPQSQTGGYYCNVCDCVVKDSINFLDHINGRKHQRNMGMSMKVEKSSLEQVRKRFEFNKKKKEEEKKSYDFAERMKELKEEEEKMKAYRREKRKARKKRGRGQEDSGEPEKEEEEEVDSEMAAVMGFSGFGGTKRKAT